MAGKKYVITAFLAAHKCVSQLYNSDFLHKIGKCADFTRQGWQGTELGIEKRLQSCELTRNMCALELAVKSRAYKTCTQGEWKTRKCIDKIVMITKSILLVVTFRFLFFGGVGFLSLSLPLTQTEIYLYFTQSLYENIRIERLSEIGHSNIPPTKVLIRYKFFSYNSVLDKLIY